MAADPTIIQVGDLPANASGSSAITAFTLKPGKTTVTVTGRNNIALTFPVSVTSNTVTVTISNLSTAARLAVIPVDAPGSLSGGSDYFDLTPPPSPLSNRVVTIYNVALATGTLPKLLITVSDGIKQIGQLSIPNVPIQKSQLNLISGTVTPTSQ